MLAWRKKRLTTCLRCVEHESVACESAAACSSRRLSALDQEDSLGSIETRFHPKRHRFTGHENDKWQPRGTELQGVSSVFKYWLCFAAFSFDEGVQLT